MAVIREHICPSCGRKYGSVKGGNCPSCIENFRKLQEDSKQQEHYDRIFGKK